MTEQDTSHTQREEDIIISNMILAVCAFGLILAAGMYHFGAEAGGWAMLGMVEFMGITSAIIIRIPPVGNGDV